jgi:hypothetical protein
MVDFLKAGSSKENICGLFGTKGGALKAAALVENLKDWGMRGLI